jgi:hypothetical protein
MNVETARKLVKLADELERMQKQRADAGAVHIHADLRVPNDSYYPIAAPIAAPTGLIPHLTKEATKFIEVWADEQIEDITAQIEELGNL